MRLFEPKSEAFKQTHAKLYALYELGYTLVDFLAAALFVVGSVLFFREATTPIGTWMFLIGSVFFGLKPTIRLIREIHLYQLGRYQVLDQRVPRRDGEP